jgi:hypothetical protein
MAERDIDPIIETKKTESAQGGLFDTGSAGPVACVLDRFRMDRVLWQIWTEYQRDFEVRPITEIQDLRAFSVLWVSTFVPEVVSVRFRNTLAREVGRYRDRPDYSSFCWYRALPIEAALYVLTGEESWLDTIRLNLDHHKMSLREVVTESLALVANRLVFDAEMLKRIAHNLEVLHFFREWPVILFATSKGDPDSKRQQVRKWLDSYDLKGDERDVLQKLVQGHLVVNPFLNRLLRTQQFLTLRLAGSITAPAEPPTQLPLLPPDQGELDLCDDPLDASVVWKRLSEHPLTASMIKIEGVNPE